MASALVAMGPYVQIARPDHWFKNSFMLLGVLLAFFYQPALFALESIPRLLLAVIATCIVASSNYVLNEILDGPTDLKHPEKKRRPVPSGKIRLPFAYVEWLALGFLGLGLASSINIWFGASAALLWLSGLAYNVPPIRTKDWPYFDVLSESANNAIRLLLGWFALTTDLFPPVSLTLSYWMLGAFFMATKRFAEYRHINNPAVAGAYRRSFRYYTEESLLISILFYATACALFGGIFIVRYHIELILFVPLAAGVFAQYLRLGLAPNSPVQHPERLYQERGFMAYMILSTVAFIMLMFTSVPALNELFNVEPSETSPLWTLGGPESNYLNE